MGWGQTKPPIGSVLKDGHWSTDGIIGCWLLNEGGGNKIFDLSGNGYYGVLTNGIQWSTDVFGTALDLEESSNQYVAVDPTINNMVVDPMSVSFWIRPESMDSGGSVVFMNRAASGDSEGIQIFVDPTNYNVNMRGSSSTVVSSSANVVSLGEWHHVLCVFNAAVGTIYVDGIQVGTGTITLTVASTVGYFNIGRYGVHGSRYEYDGILDCIAIYGRALSAKESLGLYSNPFVMVEAEDLAWLYSIVSGLSMPLVMQQMNHFNGGTIL